MNRTTDEDRQTAADINRSITEMQERENARNEAQLKADFANGTRASTKVARSHHQMRTYAYFTHQERKMGGFDTLREDLE